MTSDETILLIGHGTRDPEGARELLLFADAVAAADADRAGGGGRPVRPCFLELAEPPIITAIDQAVAEGARRIVAVPLLLQAASHMKNDIPSALAVARARYPQVPIIYGTPLGVRPEVLSALEERLAAAEEGLPALSPDETAVLLVERGSSDPDANAEVYKVARLLWEGRGGGLVETCFWSVTGPRLAEGLRRCAALGARRVIVLPYFLFHGVLLRRIAKVVEEHRALLPAVDLVMASHLGAHPALVDLALRRACEAWTGEARSNCDLCKYRARMPGFAHDMGLPQGSDHAHGLRGHIHGHGPSAAPDGPITSSAAATDKRAPMAAAPLKYASDGSVDWGNMWEGFCALAQEGGPPHRGVILAAQEDADTTSVGYCRAVDEMIRGIDAVSGLNAAATAPGWIAVRCGSERMAAWLRDAIVRENVQARSDGIMLLVPVRETYTIKEEIKSVITVVAKTTHYWHEHLRR